MSDKARELEEEILSSLESRIKDQEIKVASEKERLSELEQELKNERTKVGYVILLVGTHMFYGESGTTEYAKHSKVFPTFNSAMLMSGRIKSITKILPVYVRMPE